MKNVIAPTAGRLGRLRRATTGRLSRGQSLVEFALVLPILLLLVLAALDFGRVYLGYIALQQSTRIAANFAADHAAGMPGDTEIVARYERLVESEVALANCTLQKPGGAVPPPDFEVFANPRPTGSGVTVTLDCDFDLITPVIESILGETITASASATFPVKEGVVVAADPSGGGTTLPPVAEFIASPQSGSTPLAVTFTDKSLNLPGAWTWQSSVGVGGTGTGLATPTSQSGVGPHVVTFECTGNPGDSCVFDVSLHVTNTAGSDNEVNANYIVVRVPPDTGTVAEFDATPTSGVEPLAVQFQSIYAGDTAATSWTWDFGDGSPPGSGAAPAHTYSNAGSYDVTLIVTGGLTTDTLEKRAFIVVTRKVCTVPDFANVRVNNASALWVAAGFKASKLTALDGTGNYQIQSQTLVGGAIDPQPDGCDSSITVGPTP